MMKPKMLVIIIMVIFYIVIPEESTAIVTKRTIAVLYFENNSLAQKQQMDPLRKGLADMLITELSKIEQLQVIERAQLQKVLEEMALGQTGILDESTAQNVGKLLGAQTLLLGGFMHMLDGQMRIDVRIVEVETGLTLKAEEETGKPKKLSDLIKKLVVKVVKDLDITLTSADSKRLKQMENKSFDAALYYAKGLEYEDAGDISNAKKMYQKALKTNKEFKKAEVRLLELSKM
jgi:TolB-like protein